MEKKRIRFRLGISTYLNSNHVLIHTQLVGKYKNKIRDKIEDDRIKYSSMHLNASKHLENGEPHSITIKYIILTLTINERMKSNQIEFKTQNSIGVLDQFIIIVAFQKKK